MADGHVTAEDDAEAERAFEALRAEVSVLRRAIEALPGAWKAARPAPPPDYGADLARLVKAMTTIGEKLEEIEAKPVLSRLPEDYSREVREAGKAAVAGAAKALEREAERISGAGESLAEAVSRLRGLEAERRGRWLWPLVALLIGLAGSPFLARHLPHEWNQTVAATVMGTGRWNAGVALMRASDQQEWDAVVHDWNLLSGNKANAKTLAQCQKQAAETHKPQDCPITVPARK